MLTSRYMNGWGFPYEKWPQDLKDEYAYNPAAAKKLLAEAGYPNGFKTNVVADTESDIGMLRIIKSYFAEVGIDMEIRIIEPAAWSILSRKIMARPDGPSCRRTAGAFLCAKL